MKAIAVGAAGAVQVLILERGLRQSKAAGSCGFATEGSQAKEKAPASG
jgi:hypothetical protein